MCSSLRCIFGLRVKTSGVQSTMGADRNKGLIFRWSPENNLCLFLTFKTSFCSRMLYPSEVKKKKKKRALSTNNSTLHLKLYCRCEKLNFKHKLNGAFLFEIMISNQAPNQSGCFYISTQKKARLTDVYPTF